MRSPRVRPLIIYHDNCRDGFAAAYAAWRKFGDDADYHAAQYGTPVPNVDMRNVYILDFCYPRDVMEGIALRCESLIVLDHHQTARDDMAGFPISEHVTVTFDMEHSGAVMAWEHFHPDKPAPWMVRYAQDRDLWKWELPESKFVNAFLSTMKYDFKVWKENMGSDPFPPVYVSQGGRAVVARTEQYVIETAKQAIRIDFEGYNVPCVNAPYMDISELLAHLRQGEPFSIGWFQRHDGRFSYSLRSTPDGVNVAELAQRYGGGGHHQAAGFELDGMLSHLTSMTKSER